MNLNEYGVSFTFFCGYNMVAWTKLSIVFTKPDGTTQLTVTNTNGVALGTIAISVIVNGQPVTFEANQYVTYNFANGDVNQAGLWSARVIFDNTNASPPLHLISAPGQFTINP